MVHSALADRQNSNHLGWFNIFKGLDEYVADWPIVEERKVSLEFPVLLL